MKELSHQLLAAAEMGNIVTLRALLPQVQVDVADQGGHTSTMFAAKEGHVAVVRLLLKHGAHPDSTNAYGWTAMMQASAHGHVRCVKCFLEFGADVNIANLFKQTALVTAAARGHNDIVQSLVVAMLQRRKDDDEFVKKQMSLALSYAAYHSQISTVKLLLHFNADSLQRVSGDEWDARLFGLLSGDLQICRTLLHSATPLPNHYNTLLFEVLRATDSKEKAHLMTLLSETLPLPESSKEISIAIENGDLERLKEVIGLADAESNRLMGGTPLMFASVMGQVEIVRWLLEAGCDINAQDENNKWTALMQAVFHGHYRIVEYLLSAGADPEIGNTDGLNAHSIATMLNDEHLSEMLIKYCRVAGNSPGKKWWMKLTTKFSTIRALTAFKSKLKDGTEEDTSEGGTSREPGTSDAVEGEGSKESENGVDANNSPTSETQAAPTLKDIFSRIGEDAVKKKVNDVKKKEEVVKKEAEEERQLEEHLRSHDTKVPSLTCTHVIEVQPRIKEEEEEEETAEKTEKTDISVIEDIVHTDIVIDNAMPGPSHSDPSQALGGDLTSPDSGFISRGAHSIPLDSHIIQSEYDGLDVDIPDLPPDITPIEPSWEDWCPDHVQLSETMVQEMGAPPGIIEQFKQLNLLAL